VGVLGTGVLVAIDPAGKINSANIAKAETFSASVQNNLAFDLVGEWTFDGNANDTSGYENITSIVGSGVALAPDRRNRGSKAYSLAGSGYINTGSGANLNITNAITIEGWIKLNQLGVENGIWGKGNYQWALTMQTGNKLEFQYTDGGGSYRQSISISAVPNTNWHHIAITRAGITDSIYIDGVLDKRANNGTAGFADSGGNAFRIGYAVGWWRGADYFTGSIDDVRIYKATLLSSQIKQLYAQGLVKHLLAFR